MPECNFSSVHQIELHSQCHISSACLSNSCTADSFSEFSELHMRLDVLVLPGIELISFLVVR